MLTLSCGMWDLVPGPGIKPGYTAWRTWSLLSHGATGFLYRILFSGPGPYKVPYYIGSNVLYSL